MMRKWFVRFVSFFLIACLVIPAISVSCLASGSTELQQFGTNLNISPEEDAVLRYPIKGMKEGIKHFFEKDKSVLPTTDGSQTEYVKILKAWAESAAKSEGDAELVAVAKKISGMKTREIKALLKKEVHGPVIKDGSLALIEESIMVEQAIESIVYFSVLRQYVSTLDENLALLENQQVGGFVTYEEGSINLAYSQSLLDQCVVEWTKQINKQFKETGKIDFPSVWRAMAAFAVNKVTGIDCAVFLPPDETTYEVVKTALDVLWDVAKKTNAFVELIDSYLPDFGFEAEYYDAVFSALNTFVKKVDDSVRSCYFLGYYYIKGHETYGHLYDMVFDDLVLKDKDLWVDAFWAYLQTTQENKIVEAWTQSLESLKVGGKIFKITREDVAPLYYCVSLMHAVKTIDESELQTYKNGLLKYIGAQLLEMDFDDAAVSTETVPPVIESTTNNESTYITGTMNNTVHWSFNPDSKVLTFSGKGKISQPNYSQWGWFSATIEQVCIQDGITEISTSAFLNCTSLKEIQIPNSVTRIGAHAFSGCKSLKKLDLPNSVTALGWGIIQDCEKLTEITLPSSLSDYTFAFRECEHLERVVLQDGITQISTSAFLNCTSLKEIQIPNSVTRIGDNAFSGCKSLKKLELPNSVTALGWGIIQGCEKLTEITLPSSLSDYGYAFRECEHLERVVLQDGITKIPDYAFLNCTSLKEIQIPDSVTHIGSNAFSGCNALNVG